MFDSPILVTGTLTPSGTQDVNIISSIDLSVNVLNSSLAVTGPLTDAELRASPVPVTGTLTPSGTQDVNIVSSITLSAAITNFPSSFGVTQNTSPWVISGTVAVSNFPASTLVTQGTNPWIVDGSGSTQPISGTVTSNQGTSPWVNNITQLAGTAIDTNSGNKSAGTLRVVLATDQPQLTNALKVDGSAVTQPISAVSLPLPTGAATEATLALVLTTNAFQARINTLGQKTMANSTPVAIASDQTSIPFERVATSAVTRVTSNSAVSQTLLASNTNRKQAIFYNDSTGVQYIKFGTTASTTDFTVRMTSQSYYELPLPVYTGRIDSISGNNNGAIQVTEITA